MKRSTPLRRKTRLRQRALKERRTVHVKDPAFKAFVRTLPCWARATIAEHRCDGPIDPDHGGNVRGTGQKDDDATCLPLCRKAHRQRDAKVGPFANRTEEWHRKWLAAGAASARALYAARGGKLKERPAPHAPLPPAIAHRIAAADAERATVPPYRFCWSCSHQLYGNVFRLIEVHHVGTVRTHAACAEELVRNGEATWSPQPNEGLPAEPLPRAVVHRIGGAR